MAHERNSTLGANTQVPRSYAPEILFPILRETQRSCLGLADTLPFTGFDIWNCYELSWLDLKGKPISACCRISYNCQSPKIVESKSLKLYLYSLNMMRFSSSSEVQNLVQRDLSIVLDSQEVAVELFSPGDACLMPKSEQGIQLIDDAELTSVSSEVDRELLTLSSPELIVETVSSQIFRSLCPVTAQPDWATVTLKYEGQRIDHVSLLAYLVSYREHQGFHEDCCERIFVDIMQRCRPRALSVMCRFLRRGGVDINPIRTSPGFDGLIFQRDARQ